MASIVLPQKMKIGPTAMAEWGCLALVGVFLALVGAYDTGDAPTWRRMIYWVSTLIVGGVAVLVLEAGFRRLPLVSHRTGVLAAAIVLTASLPIAVVGWIFSGVVFGHDLFLSALPGIYPAAGTVCATALALLWLVRVRRVEQAAPIATAPGATASGVAPSDAQMPLLFQDKLGPHLRRAAILAARAEDHYVRLYTTEGEALLLLRFSDALDALSVSDGVRVHRSWWVARAAIQTARWRRGRGELTLSIGSTVPVSRSYASRLRKSGWRIHGSE